MPHASAEERTVIGVRAKNVSSSTPLYKAVPLLQDVGYHKLAAALKKQAFAYDGSKFIMTKTPKTVVKLTAAELQALNIGQPRLTRLLGSVHHQECFNTYRIL